MSKSLKWILLSVAGVVALVLVMRWVSRNKADGVKVIAEAVRRRTVVETVSASGKIYPENEVRIAPSTTGEVVELLVQEGDRVVRGQVLGRIQGDRTGAAPQPRVSLPAGVPPGMEGLLRNLQQPRIVSTASSAVLKAPIDGTILDLSVKKGERVAGYNGDLMRIADLSALEVRVNVNENSIIKVAIGDSADVKVEAYNERKFKGVVTGITNGSSKRDPQSMLSADVTAYEVHIRLLPSSYSDLYDTVRKNIPFRPGMNARADIKTSRKTGVLTVPVAAVSSRPAGSEESTVETKKEQAADDANVEDTPVTDDLQEVVFVLKSDNTVQKRVVTTGIQDMNHFEIRQGLKEGEQVVTGPYSAVSNTLRSGQKVAVVTKDKLFEKK